MASRPSKTTAAAAERPKLPSSPFHEVALLPGLKLAAEPSVDATAAAERPGTRPGVAAAAAANRPQGARDEERADEPRPMQPRPSARVANDFWWTALPRRVSRCAVLPVMCHLHSQRT